LSGIGGPVHLKSCIVQADVGKLVALIQAVRLAEALHYCGPAIITLRRKR
jgi:hypothetical protein